MSLAAPWRKSVRSLSWVRTVAWGRPLLWDRPPPGGGETLGLSKTFSHTSRAAQRQRDFESLALESGLDPKSPSCAVPCCKPARASSGPNEQLDESSFVAPSMPAKLRPASPGSSWQPAPFEPPQPENKHKQICVGSGSPAEGRVGRIREATGFTGGFGLVPVRSVAFETARAAFFARAGAGDDAATSHWEEPGRTLNT